MTAPILRFKDHGRSYPDWVQKKLKDCVTFSKGGSLSKSDLSPHGATPCLLYGELYTTYGEVTEAVINKTDSTEDLVKSQMNDVILPMSGETAEDIAKATCIKQEGVAYGGDLMVLRSKSLDGCFLSYSLNSINRRQISRIAQGKTVVHINPSRVSDISINVACLEEQQKIAAFFTALDEKIKLVENKLSKTHLLFEALIEQVLDEKLIFSDAICAPVHWQKILLKDICKKISYGINAPAGEYNGCWKYIRITDIDERTHKFNQSSPVSADMDHDQKLLTKYKVQTGDLLFARTGASVGKSYHYDQRDGNLVFAGFLIRCSLDLNKCNSYFIYLQTLTKRYSNWVKENSMRSGQPGLNSEQYGNFELVLPSLGEQEKIASFFKAFDEKMCNLSLQLKVLKKQKQAFMQQMFV